MDNHVLYYADEDGELELTRCCFCSYCLIGEETMKCLNGNKCNIDECDMYSPVGRNGTKHRIDQIKKTKPPDIKRL